MTYFTLMRIGALSAIAGGGLRVISSFIFHVPDSIWLEVLYAAIDLCLMFGLIAIYLSKAREMGQLALASFVMALCGVASIIGPDSNMGGVDLYQAGATLLMIGLAGLSVAMLLASAMKDVAVCWLLAFAAGLLMVLSESTYAFFAAGVLLGLGFIFAGMHLIRNASGLLK